MPLVGHAGAAYLEVMQQIMAAVQFASLLDVADLIQDRTTDGSLPTPVSTNDKPSLDHTADDAAAKAAPLPSSSKRKAVDRDRGEIEEAEGSQMRNAKRPRVEQGWWEQPQKAQEGQAGPSALSIGQDSPAADSPTADGADSNPRLPTVGTALPDDAVGAGPLPAGVDPAGNPQTQLAATAKGTGHVGFSSAATLDQLGQHHGRSSGQAGSGAASMADQSQKDDPEGLSRALARDGAAGMTGVAHQEQATASVDQHAKDLLRATLSMPDEETLQSAQPGPSTQAQPASNTQAQPGPSSQPQIGPSTQAQPGPSTQAQPGASAEAQPGPSTQSQAGPSTGVPDQDMQEDANPDMKEKREQARNRSRAWRKVLLDGLDLQTELTAAAAQALHSDSALAESEVKVGPFC